jgi:hypothetical protein
MYSTLATVNRTALQSSEARSSWCCTVGRCWLYSFTGRKLGWLGESRLLHMHTLPCGYGLILTMTVTSTQSHYAASASWSGRGPSGRAVKKWITNHDAKTRPGRNGQSSTKQAQVLLPTSLHHQTALLISVIQKMTTASDIQQQDTSLHTSALSAARQYACRRIRCGPLFCQHLQDQ